MEIGWNTGWNTGMALIERIIERKLEEYLANRFEFVEVKKDDSTRHRPVL